MRVFLSLALMPPLSACSQIVCTTSNETRVASPDGAHEAVVFGRTCEDTPPSTQVSILKPGEVVGPLRGNIVATDANYGEAATRADGGPVIAARWLDNATLELHIAEGARMYRQRKELNGMTIRYEPIPAPEGQGVR